MTLSPTAITALLVAASVGSLLETAPASLSGRGVVTVTPSSPTLRGVAGDGGIKRRRSRVRRSLA